MAARLTERSIWVRPPRPPRRAGLSQASIVGKAIEIADDGGPQALTMQAVARALGDFTPMSLYRYVYSKDGLIDLMLDTVLAEAPPPVRSSADWRADVFDLEMRTWTALMRHPWYAQLVHTRPPLGPNALRRTEYLLGVFSGVAVDLGSAMGYLSLVERLVIGLALQAGEEARAHLAIDIAQPEHAFAALAPLRELADLSGAYPLLARWAAAPSGPTPREQLELGLRLLLDGMPKRRARK